MCNVTFVHVCVCVCCDLCWFIAVYEWSNGSAQSFPSELSVRVGAVCAFPFRTSLSCSNNLREYTLCLLMCVWRKTFISHQPKVIRSTSLRYLYTYTSAESTEPSQNTASQRWPGNAVCQFPNPCLSQALQELWGMWCEMCRDETCWLLSDVHDF